VSTYRRSIFPLVPRALDAGRSVIAQTYAFVGDAYFQRLVPALASTLRVRYALVAECLEGGTPDSLGASTVAFWTGSGFAANFHYDLAGTPCAAVLQRGEAVCYPDHVGRLFREDRYLAELGVVSYAGAPLLAAGEVLGHIAVMDVEPMRDPSGVAATLAVVAPRAAAEMERRRGDRERELRLREVLDALRRPLPPRYLTVCAWCRRARELDGQWTTLEQHLERWDGTRSTHGICPQCREDHGVPAAR
jgi:GAF domain-containing protein